MNWLIIISHAAAMRLSYYNAAEGDRWNEERLVRLEAFINWDLCRDKLKIADIYGEFMAAGNYLI